MHACENKSDHDRRWEADPSWPAGLTVDDALIAMGYPAFLMHWRQKG